MKNLQYYGSLRVAIEASQKEFDPLSIIVSYLLGGVVGFGFLLLGLNLLNIAIHWPSIIALSCGTDFLLMYYKCERDNQKIKKEKEAAIYSINELSNGLQKENIALSPKAIQNAAMRNTHSRLTIKSAEETKKDIIETDFYMLDDKAKLVVLKEIITKTKLKGEKKEIESKLSLLDDGEINKDQSFGLRMIK